MMGFGKLAALATALALLSACASSDNAAKPSAPAKPAADASTAAEGTAPAMQSPSVQVVRNADGSITVPPLDNSQPDQPTGTAVGQKVVELKSDLANLRGTIAQQAAKQSQIHADIEQQAATYQ